jgi:hypothetical protein
MPELAQRLNELAGTTGLAPVGAANEWAGTNGLSLLGALNAKATRSGLGFNAICNDIAGTTGSSGLTALVEYTEEGGGEEPSSNTVTCRDYRD